MFDLPLEILERVNTKRLSFLTMSLMFKDMRGKYDEESRLHYHKFCNMQTGSWIPTRRTAILFSLTELEMDLN